MINGYHCVVICTSYLRVYLPEAEFSEEDKAHWIRRTDETSGLVMPSAKAWLVTAVLPRGDWGQAEGCFVREAEGAKLYCPWRIRLRALTGLLAFRGSLPEEVAEAFVSRDQVERAAGELASFGDAHPEVRSHILHANWHVPLRWFTAFDDSERVLTEDHEGLRIRYETSLGRASARLTRAKQVLETAMMDEGVIDAVTELSGWLSGFGDEGLLELDYGGVAGMFEPDDLVDDRSAAEVGICLEALSGGDLARAGTTFEALTERWSRLRSREVAN